MIVTQTRHVWSTANASMFYQKETTFRNIAGYGMQFLKEKMWDKEFGGFYDLVTRQGEPIKEDGTIKKSIVDKLHSETQEFIIHTRSKAVSSSEQERCA